MRIKNKGLSAEIVAHVFANMTRISIDAKTAKKTGKNKTVRRGKRKECVYIRNANTENISAYAKTAEEVVFAFTKGSDRTARTAGEAAYASIKKFDQCALDAAARVSARTTNRNTAARNVTQRKSVSMISFGQIVTIAEENHIASTKNNDRCARNAMVVVYVIMVKILITARDVGAVVFANIIVREQNAKIAVEEVSVNIKKNVHSVKIVASNIARMEN